MEGKRTGCERCHKDGKITIINLQSKLAAEREKLEQAREALKEVREIYAGMEGLPEPETSVEAYLLKIINDMYDVAKIGRALKGGEKEKKEETQ